MSDIINTIADGILANTTDAQTLVTFARDLKSITEMQTQIANVTGRIAQAKVRLTAALANPVV